MLGPISVSLKVPQVRLAALAAPEAVSACYEQADIPKARRFAHAVFSSGCGFLVAIYIYDVPH